MCEPENEWKGPTVNVTIWKEGRGRGGKKTKGGGGAQGEWGVLRSREERKGKERRRT